MPPNSPEQEQKVLSWDCFAFGSQNTAFYLRSQSAMADRFGNGI